MDQDKISPETRAQMQIVDTLRTLLKHAQASEIQTVAISAITTDGKVMNAHVNTVGSVFAVVGGLEFLADEIKAEFRILQRQMMEAAMQQQAQAPKQSGIIQ